VQCPIDWTSGGATGGATPKIQPLFDREVAGQNVWQHWSAASSDVEHRPSVTFERRELAFVCGAGGNRTPVHQPVDEPATTIPGIATDAVTPTGRLSARGGPRAVFPTCQRSFSPSAVFPAVIPHFCCRAVMEWPRATFLLTMTLHSSDRNQAARANCSSAILVVPPFSESEELGSQTRTALLTSKPVSPVFDMCSARKSEG